LMDGGSWKPEAGSWKNGTAEAVAAALLHSLFSLPSSAVPVPIPFGGLKPPERVALTWERAWREPYPSPSGG
jgi:hypothetical protein